MELNSVNGYYTGDFLTQTRLGMLTLCFFEAGLGRGLITKYREKTYLVFVFKITKNSSA